MSMEFQQRYGEDLSDRGFTTALYANVRRRAPDPKGFKFWSDALAHGVISRHGMLAEFSESHENQLQVADSIANGVSYILFV